MAIYMYDDWYGWSEGSPGQDIQATMSSFRRGKVADISLEVQFIVHVALLTVTIEELHGLPLHSILYALGFIFSWSY